MTLNSDPRDSDLALRWQSASGPKTVAAVESLRVLLLRIAEDGQVTDSEVDELRSWAIVHRAVLGRDTLKPFQEWLDRVLADGQLDTDERYDLLAWAEWVSQAFQNEAADKGPPPPVEPPARRTWRNDRVTERQIEFLKELGAAPEQLEGLKKGTASTLIEELMAKRDFARADRLSERMLGRLADGSAGIADRINREIRMLPRAGPIQPHRATLNFRWTTNYTVASVAVLVLVFIIALTRL